MNIVCFGECMIELRNSASGIQLGFAGDTLNTATYLARLADGAFTVHYATALGDDALYSGKMLQQWQSERINIAYVTRLPGQLPGLYAIEVDARGERQFFYWRNDSAARKYFDSVSSPLEANASNIDVFYLSGISLAILNPAARERLFQLMQTLRTAGKRIVFDNNYRPRLWPSRDEANLAFARALALADMALLTLNDEAERLAISEAQALETIRALPCAEIVVKNGNEPTLVRSSGEWIESPTIPVTHIVDTTAAGDSFAAAYLAARLKGASPVKAAEAGNQLAAIVIQHPGALIPRGSMPPAR